MSLDLGLLCPSCNRVFQLDVNTEEADETGATTVHCPVCKNHPALLLLTRYKTLIFRGVKQYPPSKIIEPAGTISVKEK
jgi:uncharacterized protein YbaR (Trm112 family)